MSSFLLCVFTKSYYRYLVQLKNLLVVVVSKDIGWQVQQVQQVHGPSGTQNLHWTANDAITAEGHITTIFFAGVSCRPALFRVKTVKTTTSICVPHARTQRGSNWCGAVECESAFLLGTTTGTWYPVGYTCCIIWRLALSPSSVLQVVEGSN